MKSWFDIVMRARLPRGAFKCFWSLVCTIKFMEAFLAPRGRVLLSWFLSFAARRTTDSNDQHACRSREETGSPKARCFLTGVAVVVVIVESR